MKPSEVATSEREHDRIRRAYRKREARAQHRPHFFGYDDFAHFYRIQERQRETLLLLRSCGINSLSELCILDVGCGDGNMLRRFIDYGAAPANVCGIDLRSAPIALAKQRTPNIDLRQGSATELPWPEASFNIVCQHTVFSSILDQKIKHQVASEMIRVLKPGGGILWYDFIFNNPWNLDVRGITMNEIRSLFNGWQIVGRHITLAPPIARRIPEALMPIVYPVLASAPFLRTHYLALMRKNR